MRPFLLAAAVCGSAVIVAVVAQERGGDFSPPPNRLVSALDADRDGIITTAEMRSSSTALRTLDTNGDGRLTPDEFFGGRGPRGRGGEGARGEEGRRGGEGSVSPDELTDTLMAFDRNQDGKLDRPEVPQRFQGLFDRADANKDGALTREEIRQSANATVEEGGARGRGGEGEFGRRGRGGPMMDPLMRALDRDRDGVLSQDEIAAAADALKTLDTNSDGRLTSDEYRPAPGRGPGGREGGRR